MTATIRRLAGHIGAVARMRAVAGAAAGAMALLLVSVLSGCGGSGADAAESGQVELRYQGSVGQVTPAELAEDLGYLGDVKLKWVGNTISGPQDIQSAATGQTDFGGAFNGAIVKLANAGAKITAVVSYYGEDAKTFNGYFVLDGSPIKSARDLVGKKVGVNTLGAHSEAVLDSYLRRNGLTQQEIDQVNLVVVPPVNTEQALRQGKVDVAVLGGILQDKALARGGLRPLFTDYELFGAFNGGSYVLTDRFIEEHPEATRQFVTGVAKAIEWTRATPREQVIARFEQIVAKRNRDESPDALQYWKSVGVSTPGGAIQAEDFSRWFAWLEQNGDIKAGEADAEELFTNEFNAYATEVAP